MVRRYKKYGVDIKEHEIRTFLIVPLLLALGWTEQRLKIKWNNIDIAFFERPYSKENAGNNMNASQSWNRRAIPQHSS